MQVIDRVGYSAASNAFIADEAGISRGAITHHFGTRAAFMAAIVRCVFDQETEVFRGIAAEAKAARTADWLALLWKVFSKPSGVAVLEILVASRSDAELAELTKPTQLVIERLGAANFLHHVDVSAAEMAVIRLVVWAIRGMTMGRAFIEGPGEMEDGVALPCQVIERAAPIGTFDELGQTSECHLIPQAQLKADIHQYHQPDHLRRRVDVAESEGGLALNLRGTSGRCQTSHGAATSV